MTATARTAPLRRYRHDRLRCDPTRNGETFDDKSFGFLWSVAAGFGYQITDNTTVDVGYRYLSSPNATQLVNLPDGIGEEGGHERTPDQGRPALRHLVSLTSKSYRTHGTAGRKPAVFPVLRLIPGPTIVRPLDVKLR